MTSFEHLHSSSRFNRSAESLETALDKYMGQADLITITEVADVSRSKVLPEVGWAVAQALPGGKAADTAILYRTSEWELIVFNAPALGDATYKNKRGFQTRPVHAAFALFKHKKSKKTLLVTVCHTPSGVQAPKGFTKTDQARAYMANINEWKRFVNWYERTREPDAVLMTGDWNIDIKKVWVRVFLKARFPNYTVNWKKPFPKGGTFGKRIIDIALLKGLRASRINILEHDPSSDHTPYRERLTFK